MSEYMFGAGRGELPVKIREQADRIASRHGATLNAPTLPGDGPIYWFAALNRGEPFDSQTARAVYADLAAAGLLDDDGALKTARTAGERRRVKP